MLRKLPAHYLAVCFVLVICSLLFKFQFGKEGHQQRGDGSGDVLDVRNETLGVCVL